METKGAIIPVTETPPCPHVPMHLWYFSLLRSNTDFRHLLVAQLVNELGDWFYSLARYDLLLKTTQQRQSCRLGNYHQLLLDGGILRGVLIRTCSV